MRRSIICRGLMIFWLRLWALCLWLLVYGHTTPVSVVSCNYGLRWRYSLELQVTVSVPDAAGPRRRWFRQSRQLMVAHPLNASPLRSCGLSSQSIYSPDPTGLCLRAVIHGFRASEMETSIACRDPFSDEDETRFGQQTTKLTSGVNAGGQSFATGESLRRGLI